VATKPKTTIAWAVSVKAEPVRRRAKLTSEESRRLRILTFASNEAIALGTPEARTDANKVARVLGFAPPFAPVADTLVQKRRAWFVALLGDCTSNEDRAAVCVNFCRFALRRPHHGIQWDEAQAQAVATVALKLTADRRDLVMAHQREDVLTKVLRAAYRKLGGTAAQAQKLLRERSSE
jgi:hypothetical protein